MTSIPQKMTVDIVSDVVCPWCAIGYKGLEKALAMLGDRVDTHINWHPFELAPYLQNSGQLLSEYVQQRYGAAPEQSQKSRQRIVDAGASVGLEFRYSEASRIFNSFKAHQLLCWAGELGRQTELKLELFKAYFTDQSNISDDEVLLDAVERAGLDREDGRAVLADQRYADMVRKEENYWVEQNITGVPAFIINGKYMIPGAQDSETFVRILERVLQKEAA